MPLTKEQEQEKIDLLNEVISNFMDSNVTGYVELVANDVSLQNVVNILLGALTYQIEMNVEYYKEDEDNGKEE